MLLNVVRRSLALRITGGPQGPSDDGITCLEAALASDNPMGWVEGCRTEKRKWTKMGVYVRYKRKMAMHMIGRKRVRRCVTVWKAKFDPDTAKFTVFRVRATLDGGDMVRGVDYENSFCPNIDPDEMRLFFALEPGSGCKTFLIDFSCAYLNSPSDEGLLMELPEWWDFVDKSDEEILRLAADLRRRVADGYTPRKLKREHDPDVLLLLRAVYGSM